MKDTSNNINENDRLRAFDFDFDAEYEKDVQKKHRITIKSNDLNYDGLNSKDNPSYFFDFSFLRKPYDYRFIKDNQHVFMDDEENFNDVFILKDNSQFALSVPMNMYINQPNIVRVYIKRIKDGFLIPVLVKENTVFNNFKQYGMSEQIANEICCTVSFYKDRITDIMFEKDSVHSLEKIGNLLRWSDMFMDSCVLLEAMTLDETITDLPRMIWVDCNRNCQHGPRIKFQHNKEIKSTKHWASVIVDKNKNFPVVNCNNKDISDKDIELLQRFVEVNAELILKMFYSTYNLDISIFLRNFKRIDNKGNVVYVSKNDNFMKLEHKKYALHKKINDDIYLIRKKDKKSDDMVTVLKDGKLLFDTFYPEIEYNDKTNIFYCYIDLEELIMDTYDYNGHLISSAF